MTKRFEIKHVQGIAVSDEDLFEDLKRCGELQPDSILTQDRYLAIGKYDPSTFKRRFGSWNKAVEAAGFRAGNTQDYSDEALFENLMRLWEHHGRQPRLQELGSPHSGISHGPYKRRFRTWTAALHEFAAFANAAGAFPVKHEEYIAAKRNSRSPSLRLRFQILKRDDFRCQACGKSPSAFPDLHLHVDHVVAWSHGEETTLENLRTLCEPCNLGKSNVF